MKISKENGPVCPKCGGDIVRRGHSRGRQRYYCRPCKWHGTDPARAELGGSEGIDREAADALHGRMKAAEGVRRYLITAAQNATPVNKPFLASLLGCCRSTGAELIVIPYRYKNPTSNWSKEAEHDDWWAPELARYLMDRRIDLAPMLTLLADIKTQPTAASPLTGFETITGPKSAIIGHPKIELTTVPTPQSRLPKIMTTTGAVTVKNYTPTKAGKKGEHHHSAGACLVEIVGDRFHIRQINAITNGSFIDIDTEYSGDATRKVRADALVMGDTHFEFMDPSVVEATFTGPGSIVSTLRPKQLVWHDFHDFYARNHHHRGKFFTNFVKHHTDRGNVETWLRKGFGFVDSVTPDGARNVFVPSNHPDAIGKWVEETDPRTDPENCVFWASTFKVMCQGAEWTPNGAATVDPFAYWGRKWLRSAGRSKFLSRGECHMIRGIDCGFHGDKGSNGAKGSLRGYSKIGVKTITGHGHGPGIMGGAYRVGTNSLLTLEYNRGAPSSWMHCDCVIYPNGKRSLIFIIGGDWRAPAKKKGSARCA